MPLNDNEDNITYINDEEKSLVQNNGKKLKKFSLFHNLLI